jgi:phosphinothricin acetyltransferase
MQGLEIRPVGDADMAAVQAIYAHHVRHGTASWELEPPDVAEMIRRRDANLALGLPYVVAERGGEILGYAYAGPYRPRPAYRFTVEDTIYVRHDLAGAGIARPLLQRVIDDCVHAGKRQMIAVVGDSENHASIRFHEKMGFRQVGMIESIGWKFGRWLDSVLMQRALGPGNDTPPAEGA